MSRYTAQDDPLCYPGTQVLKNKAGLRDQDDLDQFETLMFLTRAEEDLPSGDLDFIHYRKIHHHFFQDVYEWAGEIRRIRTGKGNNWFCYPEYIGPEMERLFAELAQENHLTAISDLEEFSERAAYYISEINAIHPFREGNGRCQLTFLTMLLRLSGWELNEDRLNPEPFMTAMVASFSGCNNPLAQEIRKLIDDPQ
ncbi:Fic/DOC family protein [Roseibium aggregatum]|uniref:protein adenylyltransferase n=1 Tax=Roseibium aggregatum TaxID=187304 RepID=A0A939J2E4_9HYPH|nr:Fic family protein [Roseibium aggregatum]MBN9673091.1 Fic family protein [Roseibium aggregatum]